MSQSRAVLTKFRRANLAHGLLLKFRQRHVRRLRNRLQRVQIPVVRRASLLQIGVSLALPQRAPKARIVLLKLLNVSWLLLALLHQFLEVGVPQALR